MKQLFRVICRGMQHGPHHHGIAYVIADDPTTAYGLLRLRLDERNLGTRDDRALDRVELMATIGAYPECGFQLLIHEMENR